MTLLGSNYVLGELIGRGAFGTVYRARDRQGVSYAIKVLRPDIAADPNVVSRFVQERTIPMQFDVPNLVRVVDFVVERDTLAIVMELVDGPTLQAHLARTGTLAPSAAIGLVTQVLNGLAALHAAEVIHRDIKPANVLLDSDSVSAQAKITDFGISWLHGAAHVTASSNVVGTPAYMSPEAARGEELTTASDIYSVGIMFYQMLFGVTPFVGGSAFTVLNRHVTHAAARPDGVPDALWQTVSALMSKNPAERPIAVQARQDLDALGEQLATLPAFARLETPLPPVSLGSDPTPTGTAVTVLSGRAPGRFGTRAGHRRRRVWIAVAAALVVLAGAGVGWAMTGGASGAVTDGASANAAHTGPAGGTSGPVLANGSTPGTRPGPSTSRSGSSHPSTKRNPTPVVTTTMSNGVLVTTTVTPTFEPSPVPGGQPTTTPKSVGSSPGGSQGTVPAPTPPTINTVSLPDGITGRTYSATLSASGTRPFSWVKAGGNLFSGLTFSSTGDITGTIDSTGTVTFTVKVTDGNGLSASRALSITSTHLQADINYDGQVNCYEYSIVKANYGKSPATYQQGDINQNGTVDIYDLSLMSSEWTGPQGSSTC